MSQCNSNSSPASSRVEGLATSDRTINHDTLKKGDVRHRFLANVSSNIAFILAQVVTNLWLIPFLIGHLGIAVFGMIPLVISITAYMAVATTAFENALSRFLAIDLERGDQLGANMTFNTAVFGVLAVVLLLSPAALLMSWVFPDLFNVPPGWEWDTSCLFALTSLAFFVTVIGGNFSVSPFLKSRFLSINFFNLAGLIARIAFIVVLFSYFSAHLWYVGGGALIAASVCGVGYVFLWRKWTPNLHIRMGAFDLVRLKSIMGMGGWVMVNMVGAMLLGRVDLIVVNTFFGAAITGGYGAVIQFSLLMEYFVSAVANVLRPVLLIKYGQQDYEGMRSLAGQSVKLLGFALALPVGLLCGFSRPFLSIWLGRSFEYLDILLIITVAHLSLNLSVRPLLFVQTAYNKVRWPGIVTLLAGAANLGLAILFARWGGWGYVGVAVAGALVWTAKNAIYVPIYTAYIMDQPWPTFMPSLSGSIIGTVSVGLTSYALTVIQMPNGWLTLAGSAALVSAMYGLAVWTIALTSAERQLIQGLFPFRKYKDRLTFLAG